MTTLREVLDDHLHVDRDIEAWAYGTEVECETCDGRGQLKRTDTALSAPTPLLPCSACQGNGSVQQGGLEERVAAATKPYPSMTPYMARNDVLVALRAELGEPT